MRPPAGDANKRVASSAARGRSYGIGFNGYQQPHGGPPGIPDRAPGLPARPELATQAGAQLQACRTQSKCHTVGLKSKISFTDLKRRFRQLYKEILILAGSQGSFKGIFHPLLKFHPFSTHSFYHLQIPQTLLEIRGGDFTHCQCNGSPRWPCTQM